LLGAKTDVAIAAVLCHAHLNLSLYVEGIREHPFRMAPLKGANLSITPYALPIDLSPVWVSMSELLARKIRVSKKVKMQFDTYKDLSLPLPLAKNLDRMGFLKPTPVQQKTIPVALSGRDVLATAQTGTGKTGAFGIPLLTALVGDPQKQALILAPTRELAAQIFSVLKDMGRGLNRRGALIVGGESFGRQVRDLDSGVDFIVATPGRLNDHLGERTVDLSYVNLLVFDEVDRMLDMGFAPQIQQILQYVPTERQTMLFSATLPREIESLAKKFQNNPERISVDPGFQPASDVKAETIRTTPDQKTPLIMKALSEREGKILVFARTQSRTDRLARMLSREGHNVVCLHGGRSQSQRKFALERFRSGSHRVMVATDLAGRGIDVADVEHVINFDIPLSREDYIHRIGRTGRAGKVGNALNLLTHEDADGEFVVTGVRAKRAGGGPQGGGAPRFGGGGGGGGGRGRRPQRRRRQAGGGGGSSGGSRRSFGN
jgi:superfamily II DNA/RNA helicase